MEANVSTKHGGVPILKEPMGVSMWLNVTLFLKMISLSFNLIIHSNIGWQHAHVLVGRKGNVYTQDKLSYRGASVNRSVHCNPIWLSVCIQTIP